MYTTDYGASKNVGAKTRNVYGTIFIFIFIPPPEALSSWVVLRVSFCPSVFKSVSPV